jgi:hypothetical protein
VTRTEGKRNACSVQRGREMHTAFTRGNVKERHNLQDLDIEWRIIATEVLQKYDSRVWSVLIWVRIGKIGGLL